MEIVALFRCGGNLWVDKKVQSVGKKVLTIEFLGGLLLSDSDAVDELKRADHQLYVEFSEDKEYESNS